MWEAPLLFAPFNPIQTSLAEQSEEVHVFLMMHRLKQQLFYICLICIFISVILMVIWYSII